MHPASFDYVAPATAGAAPTAVRDGAAWYFCSVGCRDQFERGGG
jgi:hypothetical protein